MAEKGSVRDARRLGPAEQRVVESMGLYFERSGAPRISGRILGLAMVTDGALSLEQIATTLGVSRASASTNARMLAAGGLVEPVAEPGDRRHRYAYVAGVWDQRLAGGFASIASLRRIAEDGLAALPADRRVARARLREAAAFCEFFAHELEGVVARWRARGGARRRST